MNARSWRVIQWALIVAVVAGLGIDAFVHFDLASTFRANRSSVLTEADLFRAEATAAVVAALVLLVHPRRYTAALTFVVAAGGVGAVVLYRYVDVGAFGPVPDMYDPFWAPAEKNVSAIAEGVAALAALALFWVLQPRARRSVGAVAETTGRRQPGFRRGRSGASVRRARRV